MTIVLSLFPDADATSDMKVILDNVSEAPNTSNAKVEGIFREGGKYWYGKGRTQEITTWHITVGDDAFGRLVYLEGKEAEACWANDLSDGEVQLDLDKVVKKIYGVDGFANALSLVKELGGTYIDLYFHYDYTARNPAEGGAESSGGGAERPSEPPTGAARPEPEVEIENVGAFALKWGWREIASGQIITLPKNEMSALAKERLEVANPARGRPAEAYRYSTNISVPKKWEPEKKERYEISATELGMPTVIVKNDGAVAIEVRGKSIPARGDASFQTSAALFKEIFRFSAQPTESEKEHFDWEGGEVAVDWPEWGGTNTVSVRANQTAKRVAPKKTASPPIKPPAPVSLPVEPAPRPVEEVKRVEPKPVSPVPEPVHKPVHKAEIAPPSPKPEIPAPVAVEKPRKQPQEEVRPKPVDPVEAKGNINGDWSGLEEWVEGEKWEEGDDLPRLTRMYKGMEDLKGSGVPGDGLPDWGSVQKYLHACDDFAKEKRTANNTAWDILSLMGNSQSWDEFLGSGR